MSYNVYSLPDCHVYLHSPDIGDADLSLCGHGKIVISMAGDLTSHSLMANGHVLVNRLKTTHGTITVEIPQNSPGDAYFRKWARWQKNCSDSSRIALATMTIQDTAGGFTVVCTGVTLQKVPERTFDRTATNLVVTLLATTITEQ